MRLRIPLRVRLTLASAAAMALVLAGLGGFVYLRLGAELLHGIDLELRARAGAVMTGLAGRRQVPLDSGRRLLDPDEAFAQILDPAGRVLETTTAVAVAPMVPAGELRSIAEPTVLTRTVSGVDDPARLLVVPARTDDGPVLIVVGTTLGDRNDALGRLALLLAIGGPAALALSSVVGWALAGAALRPVERMRRQAAAISEADPGARLPVPDTRDELARLATTLNALLARLQEALEREHRFVDDASHELRTPLAVLKAELDLALARPRSADELKATVRAAALETDRVVSLAEDLLVLARMRRGRLPVRRMEVGLRDLLERTASLFQGRAQAAGGRIEVRAPSQTVRVDPARVRQAVHNLLDNALRHGGGSGLVTVAAARLPGHVSVEVEDRGPGFPDVLLDRVFEPFTCGPHPPDRQAGAGLGLAIVKAVAEAHGGHAIAGNRDGGGARVQLLLKV